MSCTELSENSCCIQSNFSEIQWLSACLTLSGTQEESKFPAWNTDVFLA